MTRYRLEMNEEQARTVIDALYFFMRMRIGQWDELRKLCWVFGNTAGTQEYEIKRDAIDEKLMEARQIAMPELTRNASWGVYKFENTERAFNILKAVRSCIAWHNNPKGGYGVIYDRPLAINVMEEMPNCEVVDDGTGHEAADDGAD